jgi:outer membrane protein OmpA-like peptidoglycan-associated protein
VKARVSALIGVLLLAIAGCRIMPAGRPQGMRPLSLPAVPASVLLIIADTDSPSAMRATGALVAASARPGERVVILSARDGVTLASSQAPRPPAGEVPDPPAPPPPHPTSFAEARYRQAVRHYQDLVTGTRVALLRRQEAGLAAWASATVAQAERVRARPVTPSTLAADLGAAVSDLSSLRQAGLGVSGTVIAIMGAAGAAPGPLAGLQGSTVVVDGFSGTAGEEAAWQSSLVQDGAARAVVLTPAAGDELATVVQQGLDGAVTDTLTGVLFGLGQSTLRAGALPQLRQLLNLLIVRYPHATASINGYTDSLPVPGGNLLLSLRRAQQVQRWLIAHGVAGGRLQAFGYGDTDPVAPDSPAGQPLNRRVVVVIDPAV